MCPKIKGFQFFLSTFFVFCFSNFKKNIVEIFFSLGLMVKKKTFIILKILRQKFERIQNFSICDQFGKLDAGVHHAKKKKHYFKICCCI